MKQRRSGPLGTILVNRATYEAVEEVAVVEELEPVTVKGKAQPVPVYKVTGMLSTDSGNGLNGLDGLNRSSAPAGQPAE